MSLRVHLLMNSWLSPLVKLYENSTQQKTSSFNVGRMFQRGGLFPRRLLILNKLFPIKKTNILSY